MITPEQEDAIITFCTEEIKRQRDSPHEVKNLHAAWLYAIEQDQRSLTIDLILQLGYLAKPSINSYGFRKYPIHIGYVTKDNAQEIPWQIIQMCEIYNEGRMTPQELYMEYEYIHPFGDGNGRTGKILFNWANGTLKNPIMPENPYGWEIP